MIILVKVVENRHNSGISRFGSRLHLWKNVYKQKSWEVKFLDYLKNF